MKMLFTAVIRAGVVFLLLLSLGQPLWVITTSVGEIVTAKYSYFGDHRLREASVGGTLSVADDSSYSDPEFSQPQIAGVLGTVRSITVATMALTAVCLTLCLLELKFSRIRMPALSLDLVSTALSLLAFAYLILYLPGAARDEVYSGIGFIWGTNVEGPFSLAWGPGVGALLLGLGASLALATVAIHLLVRHQNLHEERSGSS